MGISGYFVIFPKSKNPAILICRILNEIDIRICDAHMATCLPRLAVDFETFE